MHNIRLSVCPFVHPFYFLCCCFVCPFPVCLVFCSASPLFRIFTLTSVTFVLPSNTLSIPWVLVILCGLPTDQFVYLLTSPFSSPQLLSSPFSLQHILHFSPPPYLPPAVTSPCVRTTAPYHCVVDGQTIWIFFKKKVN